MPHARDSHYLMMLIMAAIVITLACGLYWIANSPTMPPVTKSEQAIPDARIPR